MDGAWFHLHRTRQLLHGGTGHSTNPHTPTTGRAFVHSSCIDNVIILVVFCFARLPRAGLWLRGTAFACYYRLATYLMPLPHPALHPTHAHLPSPNASLACFSVILLPVVVGSFWLIDSSDLPTPLAFLTLRTYGWRGDNACKPAERSFVVVMNWYSGEHARRAARTLLRVPAFLANKIYYSTWRATLLSTMPGRRFTTHLACHTHTPSLLIRHRACLPHYHPLPPLLPCHCLYPYPPCVPATVMRD